MFVIQRSDGSLLGNSRGTPFETMEEAQLSMAYILEQNPNAKIVTDLAIQQRQHGMENQEQYGEVPNYPRERIGIFSKPPISYEPFHVKPAGRTFSKPPFSLPYRTRKRIESEDVYD